MVGVKNICGQPLEIDYNYNTYSFSSGSTVLIEEELKEHLLEFYPKAFHFDVPVDKKTILTKVKVTKTKSYITPSSPATVDFKATKAGGQASTYTPDVEVENPGFVGPGLEVDSIE